MHMSFIEKKFQEIINKLPMKDFESRTFRLDKFVEVVK